MTKRLRLQFNFHPLWRTIVLALLITLCALMTASASFQEGENTPKRGYDPEFYKNRPRRPGQPPRKAPPQPTKPVDGELIGVTIWHWPSDTATAAGRDSETAPKRLSQEKNTPVRRDADTTFSSGDRVQLSIEYPGAGTHYLYVIDRELYSNGNLSDPELIYPGRTMPDGGNVLEPGRTLFIPAYGEKGDRRYFWLTRSSTDHVSERITIIISPKPLPELENRRRMLDRDWVERKEKEWGGPTEYIHAPGSDGRAMTKVEKEADAAEKRLSQGDPLPQTYCRVAAKAGGPVALILPLKIAR